MYQRMIMTQLALLFVPACPDLFSHCSPRMGGFLAGCISILSHVIFSETEATIRMKGSSPPFSERSIPFLSFQADLLPYAMACNVQ